MAATQCASRASFCLLLDRGDKKGILFKSRQALLESLQVRTSGLFNLVFYRQAGLTFKCKHSGIYKPMVITNSAWLY